MVIKEEERASTPAFTILMPVYNAEPYLEEALRSILNQTFSDFELILINDASTDQSCKRCESFASADDRISVLDLKKNCGAAEARNKGIDVAKGKYICFVDADDIIEPDYIQKFYSILLEEEYDFIKCGAYEEYFDANGNLLYKRNCTLHEKECIEKKDIIEQIVDMEQIPLFGYLWNSVYKLSIIKENKLRFNSALKVNEDFAFNMQYLPYVHKMKCLSYCGYHYAKRNNSSLSSQQKNYDYEKHLLKVRSFLLLLKQNQMETQDMLDKVYWMFTRFTFSALEAGTSLETVRKEPIFMTYRKYSFGPIGIKKRLLTGILQSNTGMLIQPAVMVMGFVKQHLPILFAKVKK